MFFARPSGLARCSSVLRASSRSALHLPLLGAMGAVASASFKKLAIVNLVRKLGAGRVIKDLRRLNERAHIGQPSVHTAQSYAAAEAALDTLEASLHGVREQAQVQQAWRWFESLEKNDPGVAQVILKALLEQHGVVKWASALLRPDQGAGVSSPSPQQERLSEERARGLEREGESLLRKLHAAEPSLANYHVILIPREAADGKATRDTTAGEGRAQSGPEEPRTRGDVSNTSH